MRSPRTDDVLIQFDLSGSNLGATDLGGMDDIELLLEAFSQRIEEVISEVQTTTVSAGAMTFVRLDRR